MRVLVVGGEGFIGQALVARLRRGAFEHGQAWRHQGPWRTTGCEDRNRGLKG
jgi:nucleoside-diphosphate-sugar epimerase